MSKKASRKSFITIVNEIHQAYERMRDLYKFVEYNRRICDALICRVDSVEFKLRDMLKIRINEDNKYYENMKIYSHDNYFTMQQLLTNIHDMEKFIDELSHLRTYFTGKSIETTFYELTKRFDIYIKTLNVKIDVDVNSESVLLTMDIKSFEKNKLYHNKVKKPDEINLDSIIKQDSLASSPAEQDFFVNPLRINYETKINGQKKVNILGLNVYCEVEGHRQSDIELLELLQLHEEEIFNVLPTSAIGIGITFVKSYQEPSIILYVNTLPELSEQTIKNFFEILQRPPEDIVICQLLDEDNLNNSDERSNNDNSSRNFRVEKEDNNRERENNSDRDKGENKDSKDDSNGGKEYNKDNKGDSNESQGVNDENGNGLNKNNKGKEKEDGGNGGDGGDDPNDANATMSYGTIDANASANITSSNDSNSIGQVVTIHFMLSMWHPGNKDNKLEFEISKINFSGGEMLSDRFKKISGEGYYPVEAKINFKAYHNCQQDNTSVLITVEESSPYSEMGYMQISLSKVKCLSTNPNRGFREITWKHHIRNEEKKIPDYSQVPIHKAHFRYAKDLVKEFEFKTELTLEFKKKWFSKELMLRRSR
ncbi:4250_t:CDS:2, partial [Acaulospora morrowiae]